MKKKILLGTMLTLLFVSFLAGTNTKGANGTPRIYVNPTCRSRVDPPGSSFSIDIILADVADLYAWQFTLFWDSSVLEFVSDVVHIPVGVNWEDPNNYKFRVIEEDSYSSILEAVVAIPVVEPHPVVFEGTTKLATLRFNVIAEGSCILDLEDTKLSDPDAGSIFHIAEDGYFESAEGGVTTIRVDPRLSHAAPSSTFSVDITLEDVVNLAAWEFKLFWDNSVLECLSDVVHIPVGVNWEDPNNYELGDGIRQDFSASEGRYYRALVAIPVVEPHPVAFDGTTKLVTLTFHVLAPGGCILDLRDTKLSDPDAVSIPHKAVDGNFQRPDLAIEPSRYSTFTGTFDVDVTISNVDASMRLIGVDVKIRFHPCMLTAIAATEGPFMKDPAWATEGTHFFGPYFDGDYVGFGILIIPDANGEWQAFPEGEGTLATITFEATDAGSCALELFDTKLADSDSIAIIHTTVDGSVRSVVGAASPDVNGDGIVDIFDIVEAVLAFGATPEHPRWSPFADINVDGVVDIYDIVLVARSFGKPA